MRALGAVLTVVCIGVALAGVHPTQAQEAASANLPDQFQTGEMIQIQKPKKKKGERDSQKIAAAKQDTAPVPEQTPVAEEVPAQSAPTEEKKVEPNRNTASMPPPAQKPATPTEQAPSTEEPAAVA